MCVCVYIYIYIHAYVFPLPASPYEKTTALFPPQISCTARVASVSFTVDASLVFSVCGTVIVVVTAALLVIKVPHSASVPFAVDVSLVFSACRTVIVAAALLVIKEPHSSQTV